MKYENLEATTKICNRIESISEVIEQIEKLDMKSTSFEVTIKGIIGSRYINACQFTVTGVSVVSHLLAQASAELKIEKEQLMKTLEEL